MEWRVIGTVPCGYQVMVEAESKEEAERQGRPKIEELIKNDYGRNTVECDRAIEHLDIKAIPDEEAMRLDDEAAKKEKEAEKKKKRKA
jgi:hypothetical protein